MTEYARTLINRVRRNPNASRDDVLALCRELAARLDRPSQKERCKKPHPMLSGLDRKAYMRQYMRWHRAHGQAA